MAQKIQLTPVFIFVSFHYGAGILEIGKDFHEKFSGVKANIFCLGREIPKFDYDTDFWIQIKAMG